MNDTAPNGTIDEASHDPQAQDDAIDQARSWRPGRGRIGVLRIGHRAGRDKRITTHVALTARTFGADVVYIHEPDPRIVETVDGVTQRFGGPFETHAVASWRTVLKKWKESGAHVVHLTMYGMPVDEVASSVRTELKNDRDVLIVLGAEKVPFEVYEAADCNVAVGNQPHSEVAALAILLDRLTGGGWPQRPFAGKVRVVPQPRGKSVYPTETQ